MKLNTLPIGTRFLVPPLPDQKYGGAQFGTLIGVGLGSVTVDAEVSRVVEFQAVDKRTGEMTQVRWSRRSTRQTWAPLVDVIPVDKLGKEIVVHPVDHYATPQDAS